MRYLLAATLAFAATTPLVGQPKAHPLPAKWDGPLFKPVEREAVYGFAQEPTIKKIGPDRYQISFTAKGKCDVAVAVEDASGRIVRHIVYGVLSSNAPEPLQKDSLEQTVFWDGKDEFGKYVKNPETCQTRVSLGLNPTFDKIIGWHPKDMTEWRRIRAITATADGVDVLESPPFGHPTLRRYDHDGNYIKTIYPWDPDKLDQVIIAKRTLPDGKIWKDGAPPKGSRHVPLMTNYGATHPFGAVGEHSATCMAAANGKIGIFTDGGNGDTRRLLRLRSDGTTGGEPIDGGLFTKPNTAIPSFAGNAHITLSPDAKWVYVSGLGRALVANGNRRDMRSERPPYTWHAVFKFAWDDNGVVVEGRDSLVGEVSRDPKKCGAGDDNQHFDNPQGLACDPSGRLYVCDHNNNRVQIFTADGKYLKTILVKEPQEIAIHPKTAEIYVLCYRAAQMGGADHKAPITLIKFGAFDSPVERMRRAFKAVIPGELGVGPPIPLLAVDGWAAETRIWLIHETGVIRVYAERGDKWELFDDFEADVRKAGFTPFSMHGKKMGYLNADPVRGHLYRISTRTTHKRRIDPEEGKTWQVLDVGKLPKGMLDGGGLEQATFGWNGLLYARTLYYIARFDPDKFPTTGTIVLNKENELPFDYGEEGFAGLRKAETPPLLRGIIRVPWAMGGPNGYNNGLGISPRGDVLLLTENYTDFAAEMAKIKRGSTESGGVEGLSQRLMQDQKGERYRPAFFPGRAANGNLICRWNSKGELLSQDVLPGLSLGSFGIRTDVPGNLIIGVGDHLNVNGQGHVGGSLAKFAPQGARILRDQGAIARLEELPNRRPDFLGQGRAWAQNLFWTAPGLDQMNFIDPIGATYPCFCYHCMFDTDPYGRTFMPRAYAYNVLILDTNGNRICEVGRFGNADKPAMKPGDIDIGFGQCSYLATVSDKWLYIADDSNMRIIRLKLGYQAEKRVGIGGK